ncbi:hypothetical protein S245_004608, partial [Arachis hypogaea]
MMASLFTIPLKPNAEVAYEAANAAIAGGISLVLNQLVKEHPTTAFRVGNVLKIEDAKAAVNAGVKFLMSPAIVKDVMYYIQNGEVLYIPGTMTPTEILSACEAGAKMVKVSFFMFCLVYHIEEHSNNIDRVYLSISSLGGFQYISAALKKPFPHVSMVASQGIKI